MGQDISKSIIPTPVILTYYFIDGCIDRVWYVYYYQKINDAIEQNKATVNLLNRKRKINRADATISHIRKK